jgi:hypothetical protein
VCESERNRLLKRRRMVGLAASDMSEAQRGLLLLQETSLPYAIGVKHVVETGVIVSYARAFTRSSIVTLSRDEYAPENDELSRLHYRLLDLRDTRTAHTDKDADRHISVQYGVGGSVGVVESFGPVLRRDELELANELFELQRQRFLDEAVKLDKMLGDAQTMHTPVLPQEEETPE